MLKLTGFVQVDVGVHTILAFTQAYDSRVKTLEHVTDAHLDKIADYLENFYSDGVGQSLAAGIAFTNSGFAQASWNGEKFRYKRKAYAKFVLRGHQRLDLEPILNDLATDEYREMVLRDQPNGPRCAFCGAPAYLRISRDMLPMLNGRGIINFGGLGMAGLPVADWVLLAIHAMPLGCLISQGRLLAADSDDDQLVFELVKQNLERNRKHIFMSQQAGWKKLPNCSSFKTALIDGLLAVKNATTGQARQTPHQPSLTAYHFSNSGTDPKIDIYTLPSAAVDFVVLANRGDYKEAWDRIVYLARQEEKTEDEELTSDEPKLIQRNYLYEDLFDLPANARQFLRTYFLRVPLGRIKKDVRAGYSIRRDADLLSWELTALFLKRMMNMDASRVEKIKALGDRLARHIMTSAGGDRLLKDLYTARSYTQLRLPMLRAIKNYRGNEPLVDFDAYITIFEEAEEYARLDWNLARDLLLIRIFEQIQLANPAQFDHMASEIQDSATTDEQATTTA